MHSLAGRFSTYSCRHVRACHNENTEFLDARAFLFFFPSFSPRSISTVIAVVRYPKSPVIYLLFRFPRKLCGKRRKKNDTWQKYRTCISTRDRICRRWKSRKETRAMRYLTAYFMSSFTFVWTSIKLHRQQLNDTQHACIETINRTGRLCCYRKCYRKYAEKCVSGVLVWRGLQGPESKLVKYARIRNNKIC